MPTTKSTKFYTTKEEKESKMRNNRALLEIVLALIVLIVVALALDLASCYTTGHMLLSAQACVLPLP